MLILWGCSVECDNKEINDKLAEALEVGATSAQIIQLLPEVSTAIVKAMKSLMNKGCRPERIVIKGTTVQALPSSRVENAGDIISFLIPDASEKV